MEKSRGKEERTEEERQKERTKARRKTKEMGELKIQSSMLWLRYWVE